MERTGIATGFFISLGRRAPISFCLKCYAGFRRTLSAILNKKFNLIYKELNSIKCSACALMKLPQHRCHCCCTNQPILTYIVYCFPNRRDVRWIIATTTYFQLIFQYHPIIQRYTILIHNTLLLFALRTGQVPQEAQAHATLHIHVHVGMEGGLHVHHPPIAHLHRARLRRKPFRLVWRQFLSAQYWYQRSK
jgi:hypothetical protein